MKIKKNEPTAASMLITQYARERGMSLEDISKQTGISYSHVTNLLNGVRDITPKNAKKFYTALKLSKEEQLALKEAIFISNKNITVSTKNKKEYVLKLLYWIVVKSNTLSITQAEKCMDIVRYGKYLEKD